MRRALSLSVILLACMACSQHRMMTHESFDQIQLGIPVSELTAEVGRPYAVHTKGAGKQEYEYIERMELGPNLAYENHYYITIIDGVVIRKRVRQVRPPAYENIYQEDPNDLIRD